MSQRLQVRLLSIFVLFVAWEYFGRRANPILFTYPTAIIRAFKIGRASCRERVL